MGLPKLAHGTKLKMGDGASSEAFATVANTLSIGLPGQTRAAVDVSDNDTEDYMAFLASALADGGTVAVEGHLVLSEATQGVSSGSGFVAAMKSGAMKNWQIEGADGTWRVAFAAFATAFGGTAPSESGAGKVTFSGELKVNGEPVFSLIGA